MAETTQTDRSGDHPRVLVVDDSVDYREAIGIWLERHGFAVILAGDGAEGLEAAADCAPDAILMDISMPVLDGVSATARLKASASGLAAIPVIGFTAHPLASIEARAKAAGMVGVFSKQGLRDLLAALRRVVSQR